MSVRPNIISVLTQAISVVSAVRSPISVCPVCGNESWMALNSSEMRCQKCGTVMLLGGLGYMKRPWNEKDPQPEEKPISMRRERQFE